MMEFGTDLSITYVMGGLAREFTSPATMIVPWLDASDRSGMPVDPRLWSEAPIGSSYPACMAVKAAAEQGPEATGRYLRALREGLMCFRRKLDTVEALVSEARSAGLDVARFRASLESNAIVEAFGADLEETRAGELSCLFPLRRPGHLGGRALCRVAHGRAGRRRRAHFGPAPGPACRGRRARKGRDDRGREHLRCPPPESRPSYGRWRPSSA